MNIPHNWTFDTPAVASAFDRHVREQLPWYDMLTGIVCHIVRHYAPERGRIYDIGASTGNIGRNLAQLIDTRELDFIAIESSASMAAAYNGPGHLIYADAATHRFRPFDVAILFLTMMFIPPDRRAELLRNLRNSVRPGGVIIVCDKMEAGSGYPATVLWRIALAGKYAASVAPEQIIEKELSLAGVQRPIKPDLLGEDAVEFFRMGEFAGYLIDPT